MIVNLNLTLYNKTNVRLWVKDIDRTKTTRFLKALSLSKNVNEQFILIEKIRAQKGYNGLAERTIQYTIGKSESLVYETKYVPTKNVYRKGKLIEKISLI